MKQKGMRPDELAWEADCSEKLIDTLIAGGITHPNIAARIADLTGATMKQYNGIVHRRHWGKYVPGAVKNRRREKAAVQEEPRPVRKCNDERARPVVAIDREGREIARFGSIMEASEKSGCSESVINARCRRKIGSGTDEFKTARMTFRYAAEWDGMTRKERERDAELAATRW